MQSHLLCLNFLRFFTDHYVLLKKKVYGCRYNIYNPKIFINTYITSYYGTNKSLCIFLWQCLEFQEIKKKNTDTDVVVDEIRDKWNIIPIARIFEREPLWKRATIPLFAAPRNSTSTTSVQYIIYLTVVNARIVKPILHTLFLPPFYEL